MPQCAESVTLFWSRCASVCSSKHAKCLRGDNRLSAHVGGATRSSSPFAPSAGVASPCCWPLRLSSALRHSADSYHGTIKHAVRIALLSEVAVLRPLVKILELCGEWRSREQPPSENTPLSAETNVCRMLSCSCALDSESFAASLFWR